MKHNVIIVYSTKKCPYNELDLGIECLGSTYYNEALEGNVCLDCGFYDGVK